MLAVAPLAPKAPTILPATGPKIADNPIAGIRFPIILPILGSFTSSVLISPKVNGSYRYVEPSSVCAIGVISYL